MPDKEWKTEFKYFSFTLRISVTIISYLLSYILTVNKT